MAPRSKRSRTNQNNARKRFQINRIDPENGTCDMPLDATATTDEAVLNEESDAHLIEQIEEEMYVEEVLWDNGEIAEKLKTLRTSYYSEADKYLKYRTRPGDSERTLRRWKAKLKTDIRMGSLLDYNFTVSSGRDSNDQSASTGRSLLADS
ncbi:hypothetical protein V1525DRAFT_422921 [Lipomyces kononenkoae]|uniref:Uncharacterized protein n=1 Tax=Lipomyces kononenkoae TaxID=34357 RepID=A0ACC3SPW9_LIPKO